MQRLLQIVLHRNSAVERDFVTDILDCRPTLIASDREQLLELRPYALVTPDPESSPGQALIRGPRYTRLAWSPARHGASSTFAEMTRAEYSSHYPFNRQ